MEIKVNDYVRTKDGIIDKVIIEYNGHCASSNCNCKHVSCERNYYDEDKIIKTSPRIIDLICVGDYVNGCKVSEIKDKWLILNYADIETYEQLERKNENIKSVVTKEMFEQMEYKIN